MRGFGRYKGQENLLCGYQLRHQIHINSVPTPTTHFQNYTHYSQIFRHNHQNEVHNRIHHPRSRQQHPRRGRNLRHHRHRSNRSTNPRNPSRRQWPRRRRTQMLRHSRDLTPPSFRQHPLCRRLRPYLFLAKHQRADCSDLYQPHEYVHVQCAEQWV